MKGKLLRLVALPGITVCVIEENMNTLRHRLRNHLCVLLDGARWSNNKDAVQAAREALASFDRNDSKSCDFWIEQFALAMDIFSPEDVAFMRGNCPYIPYMHEIRKIEKGDKQ